MVGTQLKLCLSSKLEILSVIFSSLKFFDINSVAQPLRQFHPKRFFIDQGCLKSLDVPSMVTSKALRGRLTHLCNVTFLNKWRNNNFLRQAYDYDTMCSETDFAPEQSFSSNYKNSQLLLTAAAALSQNGQIAVQQRR